MMPCLWTAAFGLLHKNHTRCKHPRVALLHRTLSHKKLVLCYTGKVSYLRRHGGFTLVEGVVVLLIVIAIGFVGFKVWQRNSPMAAKTPTQSSSERFKAGIYFREPDLNTPSAVLGMIGEKPPAIQLPPVDFDLHAKVLAHVLDSTVYLIQPDGTEQKIDIPGLYQMVRPTLSPDDKKLAVQATTKKPLANQASDFRDLGIYVIDLRTKQFVRANDIDPSGGSEAPDYFHRADKVVYSNFNPTSRSGSRIRVYDIQKREEVLSIPGASSLHTAVSFDDRLIMDSIGLIIYDATSGKKLYDLKSQAVAAIQTAGYTLSSHDGQNGRGSFPLDGDFAPDSKSIVFDGAVTKDGQEGFIICQINLDGTGFKILRDILPANPTFSNNFNFSQANPTWLP
jgi:hypothetical protein